MNIELEIDAPQTAAANMQKDAAIFSACEARAADNIHLRFYSWLRPAVTFGYAQRPEKLIDLPKAARLGVETASRITGGGLVLHQPNELTYSLAAPLAILPAGIIPSCNFIAEIFIRALRKLGANAELASRAERRRRPLRAADQYEPQRPFLARQASAGLPEKDICFARPVKYEVVCGGKKLLGSAQKRGRYSLLQQGSLALEPPLPVFAELLELRKLNQTNIQECAGREYAYTELAEIIGREFKAFQL
jgi:lipoate-protein ligase A